MTVKILFTTPVLAYPAAGGPALRIQNSIKALYEISELHVVSRCSRQAIGGADAEAFFSLTSSAFGYAPHQKGNGDHDGEIRNADAVVRYAHQHQIGIIWCGFGNISHTFLKEIKRLDPSLKVVCDTDAVWSRFVLRELPFESDPAHEETFRLKVASRRWKSPNGLRCAMSPPRYRRSMRTIIVTSLATKAAFNIFPNAIDLDSYIDVPAPALDVSRPALFMAGSFYSPTSPMARAARWMITIFCLWCADPFLRSGSMSSAMEPTEFWKTFSARR